MLRLLRAKPGRFRLRSKERDHETDRTRFDAVFQAIKQARDEVVRETDGLRARYEAARTDASFSLDSLENEGADKGVAKRLDVLEDSVVYYEQRIRELTRQASALAELGSAARSKLAGSGGQDG